MLTSPVPSRKHALPIGARRVFRLSSCIALSLFIAYGMAVPLPFLAPMFALILGIKPAPPIGFKGLTGLVLVVVITLGMGLLLAPVLISYPVTAILMVALGIYLSSYLTVIAGKALVGTFLTMGVTMISAAGVASFSLAYTIVLALAFAIVIAVACQWLVYYIFPENAVADEAAVDHAAIDEDEADKPVASTQSNWIALRATLIILPAYFIALINPSMYLAIIMKSVSLGQQASSMHARDAGRELLGSTFLAGCFAIVFWFMLDLVTSLWMFSCLMLLFAIFFVGKIYRIIASRYPPSYWQNTLVTMLILIGPAVEDSADGKDVYQAFALRMSLFLGVTLYACAAVYLLEMMRYRRILRKTPTRVSPQPALQT
jgi:Protein of unknown function (DUF2955)